MSEINNIFTVIHGNGIPHSELPFSPAVCVGNFVFVSGQASVDENGHIINDTFAGEMRRTFENVVKLLAGANLTLRHVVKVSSYVGSQDDLAEYNRIFREFFSSPYPARTTLIGCLGNLLKFEADVIAVRQHNCS